MKIEEHKKLKSGNAGTLRAIKKQRMYRGGVEGKTSVARACGLSRVSLRVTKTSDSTRVELGSQTEAENKRILQ